MNRRKAITRLLAVGGGGVLSYAGIKAYNLYKVPHLGNLDSQQTLIADLAETIIPATDTPGAKEAGVGEFIIKMVRDCTTRRSQNKFLSGLGDLADYSHSEFKMPFSECSKAYRIRILRHFEKAGAPYKGIMGKIEHRLLGDSFFTTLKKYTVLGYCTSKQGATEALAYDYIPGKYSVTPLKPGQKAWAMQ
jgi:hypothetical protein